MSAEIANENSVREWDRSMQVYIHRSIHRQEINVIPSILNASAWKMKIENLLFQWICSQIESLIDGSFRLNFSHLVTLLLKFLHSILMVFKSTSAALSGNREKKSKTHKATIDSDNNTITTKWYWIAERNDKTIRKTPFTNNKIKRKMRLMMNVRDTVWFGYSTTLSIKFDEDLICRHGVFATQQNRWIDFDWKCWNRQI